MAGYQSKFRGSEVDGYLEYVKKLKEEGLELSDYAKKEDLNNKQDTIPDLDAIRSGSEKGATALQSVPSEYVTDTELTNKGYATTSALNKKVDKVSGKQLSTEDFTSALKTKLEGLSNYDDTEIENAITSLQTQFNTLVSGNASDAINSFNEIIAFLDGVKDSEDFSSIIASIEQQIAAKQDKITDLETIRSGAAKGATALQKHQDISHLAEKSEVKTLSEDVAQHGGDITALQTVTEEQGTLAQESKGRLDNLEPIVTEIKEEVDILTGTGEGSVVDIASKEVAKVIDSAPETMDTLKKIADLIEKDAEQAADILATLGDHEARIGTLENKFVVMSETDYENLTKKEDKFYFCYED